MPKDEFDFEDPFELNGMAFMTHEDTTNDMAECFTEEFMRMGYDHQQVLALFRNPHYLGPHMALEKRGELVHAHPDFQLVISYNPGYQSVLKDLKQSTKQRFMAIEFDYPPADIETAVVEQEAGQKFAVATLAGSAISGLLDNRAGDVRAAFRRAKRDKRRR